MTNLDKLNAIFCEVFGVEQSVLDENFTNNNVKDWDSVRQLTLTAAIEDTFEIFLDPEDIIACISYESAKDILVKYELSLND